MRVPRGEVIDIGLYRRIVTSHALGRATRLLYDSLIIATGSARSYFGHDEFAVHAPGLKSIYDALEVRGRIFGAFEMAENGPDPQRHAAWLMFALIGAGPTGVEMAGQIAELSRQRVRCSCRQIDPAQARILLFDDAPRILPAFDERPSTRVAGHLRRLGVEVHTGATVVGADADGARQRMAVRTKVWSAGSRRRRWADCWPSAAAPSSPATAKCACRRDCTEAGHAEVFVVGGLMALESLPVLAEVALQAGLHAASEIRRLEGDTASRAFRDRDLGSLAAISRSDAIEQPTRVKISSPGPAGVAGGASGVPDRLREPRHGAVFPGRQLLRPGPAAGARSTPQRVLARQTIETPRSTDNG